jgi:hypothetical protein
VYFGTRESNHVDHLKDRAFDCDRSRCRFGRDWPPPSTQFLLTPRSGGKFLRVLPPDPLDQFGDADFSPKAIKKRG